MIKALVLGASGATGQLLVTSLLRKGIEVIAIVRDAHSLANRNGSDLPNLQIVEANIAELSENDLAHYLKECELVFSCLGHNLTFKGMFGHPRRLVKDAIEKVAQTVKSINNHHKIKFILMNTTGNSNRDIPEKPPYSQRIVISLLRLLLPPHVDNEDGLVNEQQVSPYDINTSPIRNVIFNAGSTSRINVADFMSELAVNQTLWDKWQGKMPVIYNQL
jgi:nucleoside-diphosphate-sugar epimerase